MTINAHHFKILTNHLTFVSDGSIFVLICWAWLPRIFPVDLRGSLCNFCSDIFSWSVHSVVLNKNNSSSLESWSFFNGRDRFKRSSTESLTRSQRLSFSQSAQLCVICVKRNIWKSIKITQPCYASSLCHLLFDGILKSERVKICSSHFEVEESKSKECRSFD